MYLLIIVLPLLGSITSLLFGRFLGKGGPIITIINLCISFLLTIILVYEVILQYSPVYLKLYNYINFQLINIEIEFIFDQLSVSMLFIIIFISLLVHIYSFEYLSSDPHLPRFMGYLSLFTFMMILMVTSNNYFQLFLGWEGVGLASYLLINFWFRRIEANKSAFKAVVYNRFGDLALILALLIIFKVFKSFDFEIINATLHIAEILDNFNLFLIGLLLIIAALAKSAQIGLHGWLPDAMEGPTPVSALLHAATMVTAGIYLLIRSQAFFIIQPNLLITMTIIGSLTAFFAASTGLTQNDIKKIIAYSTCSQLGYMFLACGLGQFSISFFHLINHAFFKALLFLAAGCVIHAWAAPGRQDIRYMGSAIHYLPFTYSSFLIGSIALMGFPFLTGFYSKDLIIETAFGGGNYEISSYFSFWLALFTAFLTAFYSIRLLYYTFISSPLSASSSDNPFVTDLYPRDRLPVVGHPHESNIFMSLPLLALSFFSLFFGYIAKDLFVGIGTPIFSAPNNFDSEFIDPLVRLYPFIFSSLGVICAWLVYYDKNYSTFGCFAPWPVNESSLRVLTNFYWFFNGKWFFDTLASFLSNYFLLFAYLIPLKSFDRGIIEIIGPTGLSKISSTYWKLASNNYQTGHMGDVVFGILSVTTAMLIIIMGGPIVTATASINFVSSFKIISLLAPWLLINTAPAPLRSSAWGTKGE